MYSKLNDMLKVAMKNKDQEKLNFIRNLKTKINERLVAEKLPRDKVSDEIVGQVAQSYRKSLLKGAAELEKNAEKAIESSALNETISLYKKEAEFCEQFAPAGPSRDEVRKIVEAAVLEVGSNNMGKVMGCVMKNNKGLDGNMVKELVREVLGS